MKFVRNLGRWAAMTVALTVMGSVAVQADPIADFYKGRTVTLIVSAGGGNYTLIARTLARHMPKHLAGSPTIIVKNMPGAGHVRATNFMYNKAAKDGSYIATVGQPIPLHQALGGRGVRYDASKFNWLGSTGITNLVSVVMASAGVKTIADVQKREVIAGGTGAGGAAVIYPTLMNNLLGTKFKIVIGYRRASNIDLAMERGEVQARGAVSLGSLKQRHPDWIKEKKVNFLFQVGFDKTKGLPNVPLLTELATTPDQLAVFKLFTSSVAQGRAYLAPPKVPKARVAALRKAFAATLKDPGFVKDQKKARFDLFPMTGPEVAKIVSATINTPKDIIALAKAAMKKTKRIQCKSITDAKNCKSKKKRKKRKKS